MARQLPALPKPPAREMAGPTPYSNWVIPAQVIAGAYPASMDDRETERVLTLLLELGINTFVCLQAEVNIHTPDHVWRARGGLRPYIRDAQRLLSRAYETNSSRIAQRKIDFLHLPIIDGSVTTDMAMSRLADDCCERVLRGEKLYIHCWGGHGRTGTLVATLLGRLYGLPFSAALRHTQAYHDSRVYPQGVRSPQTTVQRAQVRRLLLLPSQIATRAATSAISSLSKNIGLVSASRIRDTSSSSAASELAPANPAMAAGTTGAWRAPAPAVTAGSSYCSNSALNNRACGSSCSTRPAMTGLPGRFTESNLAGVQSQLLQPNPAKAATAREVAATVPSATAVLYGSSLQQSQQLAGIAASNVSSVARSSSSSSNSNVNTLSILWSPVPRTPVSNKSSLLRRSLQASKV